MSQNHDNQTQPRRLQQCNQTLIVLRISREAHLFASLFFCMRITTPPAAFKDARKTCWGWTRRPSERESVRCLYRRLIFTPRCSRRGRGVSRQPPPSSWGGTWTWPPRALGPRSWTCHGVFRLLATPLCCACLCVCVCVCVCVRVTLPVISLLSIICPLLCVMWFVQIWSGPSCFWWTVIFLWHCVTYRSISQILTT